MMKLLKKVSVFITSGITGKLRAMLGKILTLPNALAKKLMGIIKAPFKTVFGKPSSIKDYVPVSDVYVSKRLIFTVIAGAVFAAFFVKRYVIPYLEGRLWIPTIVINTPRFHTYEGNARVVSREGGLIYAGSLKSGETTGYGALYDGERLIYEGNFSENNYDGVGKLYYTDGNVMFAGVFENGEYKEGVLSYEDGSPQFDGHFENNIFNEGRLYYKNGKPEFEGLFESGMYKEGRLYLEDGSLLYDGTFLNGVYDGTGKEYVSGRLKYEGDFASGKYNGLGRLYNSSFTVYEGNFRNGLFEGYGKLYAHGLDKLLYEGGFSAGRYEGTGTLYFQNGGRELYTGGFSDGLYNGEGVLYNAQGRKLYTGAFYMGEIDYMPFIDAEIEVVREAFGAERRLNMLENSFLLFYDGIGVLFEFSFADEGNAPGVQKIKLLGEQRVNGVRNGMTIAAFKRLFGEEIFTEYYFEVNTEEEIPLSMAGSELVTGDEVYCIKYDLASVYIRSFAESEKGNVIYYEIGGV